MKLSVAIATHNEKENIIRCLKAVYDWVDEIVVVDGESSDNTVDLIKKQDTRNKIQIFTESNPPMFHINKQKAIERCKGDWILQLDADEVVSEELKREIQNIIAKTSGVKNPKTPEVKHNNLVAYWIPRLNFFLGRPLRKGGQYPDYTIRLYRNGVAHFPCRTVHEQVEIAKTSEVEEDPELVEEDGKTPEVKHNKEVEERQTTNHISYLKHDLLHYPYPTFTEYLNKWLRYVKLEAELLRKKGVKPSAVNFVKYVIIEPIKWFLLTYVRHKGFMDGFAGFVFSLFSALRYWLIYIKLNESKETRYNIQETNKRQ